MGIRIRFLAANIAVLTAVAGLFNPLSPEWTAVYEKRLFLEMEMNMEREKHEQTTGKKILSGSYTIPTGDERIEEAQVVQPEEVVSEPQAEEETASGQPIPDTQIMETVSETVPTESTQPAIDQASQSPVVSQIIIDGDILDPGIADYLYRRLSEAGIGWFFEYSVCLIYQESRFDPLAQNPNGRDKGILQYRVEFYPGMDWTNPYQQIDVYCQQMANRLNVMGCSVEDAISRHNVSDYGVYNPVYVQQVLQHILKLWR